MILSLKNQAEQGLSAPHSFAARFSAVIDPIVITRSPLRLLGTYFGVVAELEPPRLRKNCPRIMATAVHHFRPADSGS